MTAARYGTPDEVARLYKENGMAAPLDPVLTRTARTVPLDSIARLLADARRRADQHTEGGTR